VTVTAVDVMESGGDLDRFGGGLVGAG